MNQDKPFRKPRKSTVEQRKNASEVLLESGILIPSGSLFIPNPTNILKDKLGITTACVVRPASGKTPARHSFGEMIVKDGPGGWYYSGIGLVMTPTETNVTSPRVENAEKALENLSRNEVAQLIGRLATKISTEE